MILTNPLFLICLAAIAIPIVVHLFNFRRYKKVYFSNVERLTELTQETRKQSTLRQYLILALRILAIVFLVLAFAQPVIPLKNQQLKHGNAAVSVYLDNSFSMDNTNSDGILLEAAKKKAREVAAAYGPSGQFQLMTNDADGNQFRWLNRDEYLEAVDAVQISPASLDIASVASRLYDFLHSAHVENMQVYLISDFQQSACPIDAYPNDTLIETTWVPIEGMDVNNLYIDSLAFNAPAFCQGGKVQVEVWVHNTGDRDVEEVPMKLFVNEQQRALASVNLPADGSMMVPLSFTIDAPGILNGRVELVDHPITFDDACHFSLNVAQRLSMLVIGGTTENVFLRRLFADDSLVHYQWMPESHIDYSQLTAHDLIVLDEPSQIASGLAQSLQEFVSHGGSLLVIPSAKGSVESYNTLLQDLAAPQLGGWSDQQQKVVQVHSDNPLYAGVFDGATEEMETPTIKGHYQLKSDSRTIAMPVMTLADGGNYLTMTPSKEGRLYLFATPLRDEYSDFPSQALFVPTLYNMALFSRPLLQPYYTIGHDDPIALQGDIDDNTIYKLINTDGTFEVIPDIQRMGGRHVIIPHHMVREAGNYLLADEGVAFNYDRSESQMRFYNHNELSRLIKSNHLAHCSVVRTHSKPLDQYIRQQNEGTPLWRWCIILCLLMLLGEILILRFWK